MCCVLRGHRSTRLAVCGVKHDRGHESKCVRCVHWPARSIVPGGGPVSEGSTLAIDPRSESKTIVDLLLSGSTRLVKRLAASYPMPLVFPSESTVATSLLAASNTFELTKPSGLVELTNLLVRHTPSCSYCQADRRLPPVCFAASNTFVRTNPKGFVELTGLLAASYPSVVRLPSGSTDDTMRFEHRIHMNKYY